MSDSQTATHFRCAGCGVVLLLSEYQAHLVSHGTDTVIMTPLWQDA